MFIFFKWYAVNYAMIDYRCYSQTNIQLRNIKSTSAPAYLGSRVFLASSSPTNSHQWWSNTQKNRGFFIFLNLLIFVGIVVYCIGQWFIALVCSLNIRFWGLMFNGSFFNGDCIFQQICNIACLLSWHWCLVELEYQIYAHFILTFV